MVHNKIQVPNHHLPCGGEGFQKFLIVVYGIGRILVKLDERKIMYVNLNNFFNNMIFSFRYS